jgi:hypothetical protein
MKYPLIAALLSLYLCGCVNPVPSNRISGSFAGQPFKLETKKQTTAKGVELTMRSGTNNLTLKIAEISGMNDPQVIEEGYAGQAAVTKAHYDGVTAIMEKAEALAAAGGKKAATGGVAP